MAEWRKIPNIKYYMVSDDGRVKSFHRKITGELMKQTDHFGYKIVGISVDGITLNMLVHRLVGFAFIPNEMDRPQINHINGIKSDNRIENLEWVTAQLNIRHAFDTGLRWSRKYGMYMYGSIISRCPEANNGFYEGEQT